MISKVMKRILVVGCAGAGKSTFSKRISEEYDIPSVLLDHMFWQPDWVEREELEFDALLQKENHTLRHLIKK